MSPVYKLSANSVKNGRTVYGSMLAGNSAFVPPSFESIATVTVGSGGAANVEFTSIPSGYAHLQVRFIGRSTSTSGDNPDPLFRLNGDTGSNYRWHDLSGDGATATAYAPASASTSGNIAGWTPRSGATASVFSGHIVDILDYTNTNKYTTVRSLGGFDANGSGIISLRSSLWMNTNAVTSILLYPSNGNWVQYTTAALYGIKSA